MPYASRPTSSSARVTSSDVDGKEKPDLRDGRDRGETARQLAAVRLRLLHPRSHFAYLGAFTCCDSGHSTAAGSCSCYEARPAGVPIRKSKRSPRRGSFHDARARLVVTFVIDIPGRGH